MRNEGLQKTLIAGAAVNPNRIVKFGAADNQAIQAAAATDKMFGVSDNLGAASGETFDVIVDGIALVKYGGNVAVGDLLTSDANGQAIATTTASNRMIGVAMDSGVSGDIGSVLLSPGSV